MCVLFDMCNNTFCGGDAGGVGGGSGFWGMKLYIFCEIENNLDLAFSQVVAIHSVRCGPAFSVVQSFKSQLKL